MTKQQKCHTIAEKLIMPCAKAIMANACHEDQAKKLNTIPLSNNTILRRVNNMAKDTLGQAIEELYSSPVKFCFQFDESMDVRGNAVLLGFIRHTH